VTPGLYDVVLVRGAKTKIIDAVLALGDNAAVNDIVATLTVDFPGIEDVHVYVRTNDGIAGTAAGGQVEGKTNQDGGTSFVLLKNIYDVVLVRGAKVKIMDAVNCAGATCLVADIVATLTVEFPGIEDVHVYVRTNDGVVGTATGGQVEAKTYQDGGTSFFLLKNTYDVVLVRGAKTKIMDAVSCTGPTCLVTNIVATLAVEFPGIEDVHVYVRTNDGVAGTATGGQVEAKTNQDSETSFVLLKNTYDVVLVRGAKTMIIDGVNCTGATCQVNDIVASLTVDFPGINDVHVYVRVDDENAGIASGGLVESETYQDGGTSFVLLKNTYDVVLVRGGKTKIIDSVSCTAEICEVKDIVATLTVEFPGIEGVHVYVYTNDDAAGTATGGLVESKTYQDNETSFVLLKNTYDVVLVRGAKVKIVDAVDCTDVTCMVDEVVAAMAVYFPTLSGVHVYVRVVDGTLGTAVGGIVETRLYQSESIVVNVLRNHYDVVIVKATDTEIHDAVDCTAAACEVWDPTGGTVAAPIDIMPGGNPNSMNLTSRGKTPVAVLTDESFFAPLVDPDTVVFAGAFPVHWAVEDVDDDGDPDMIFQFKTQDLALDDTSTEAELTGITMGGQAFSGVDTVNIVPK
jgi:hypothetical protein